MRCKKLPVTVANSSLNADKPSGHCWGTALLELMTAVMNSLKRLSEIIPDNKYLSSY